jgi:hypothetical protein
MIKAKGKQGKQVTKTQEKGDEDGSSGEEMRWVCALCDIGDDDESRMLECERCDAHYCIKCIDMNEETYKFMSREEVLWCCKKCTPMVRKMLEKEAKGEQDGSTAAQRDSGMETFVMNMRKDLDETITTMKEMVTDFRVFISKGEEKSRTGRKEGSEEQPRPEEPSTSTAEANAQKEIPWKIVGGDSIKVKPLRDILKETNEEARKEAEEEAERKKNIIIHRMPELDTEDTQDRREEDKIRVEKFLEKIGLENRVEVERIIRMGKRPEKEEEKKARPMKVVLQSEEETRTVFKNLYKLKNAHEYDEIRITPDRNEQQREELRALVETAKNLTRMEQGDYVHVLRGKRIVRVKKRASKGKKVEEAAKVD